MALKFRKPCLRKLHISNGISLNCERSIISQKEPFEWQIIKFKIVANDYEMTLHANSKVEEAGEEGVHIPEYKHNFVKVDELGPYVNSRDLVGECPLV